MKFTLKFIFNFIQENVLKTVFCLGLNVLTKIYHAFNGILQQYNLYNKLSHTDESWLLPL